MNDNLFTCYTCKKTYPKGRSDEEALAEHDLNFPGQSHDTTEAICHDCFLKMNLPHDTTPPIPDATIQQQFDLLLKAIAPVAKGGITIPAPIRKQMERMFFMGYRVAFLSMLSDMQGDPALVQAHWGVIDAEMQAFFKTIEDEHTVTKAIAEVAQRVKS